MLRSLEKKNTLHEAKLLQVDIDFPYPLTFFILIHIHNINIHSWKVHQ